MEQTVQQKNKYSAPFQTYVYAVFALFSIVIIFDFVLPGTLVNEGIKQIKRVQERYYNGGGNSHYSFHLVMQEREFAVAEGFAKRVHAGDQIEYTLSPLFSEVNWCRKPPSTDKSFYVLRLLSGLAIPLFTLLSLVLEYRYKMKIDIAVFILQVLLVADLVYLIL